MSLINHIANLKKGIENISKYGLSGDIQAHQAYLMLKESRIEELLKDELELIKKTAVENLKNNILEPGKKSYKENGYVYTVRDGGTRYYFTDVPEYQQANNELKASEPYAKVKAIEQKYKTAFLMRQKNQSMVDDETGEIIDVSGVNVVYNPDTISIKKIDATDPK